eukprot:CAMPEP_0118944648 /NCGR_PEP_ID=MMETSP1169-20130426/40712_1 /TAXON_ID=36882 /ORGANISM="Pyramimonas obovata, Strain CCMP722" /LENGTH=274 /DNA_ID=CAMNT_0006890173 /DNA_START=437 /DNA_END=1258 /DNA_ORIENTATION=+
MRPKAKKATLVGPSLDGFSDDEYDHLFDDGAAGKNKKSTTHATQKKTAVQPEPSYSTTLTTNYTENQAYLNPSELTASRLAELTSSSSSKIKPISKHEVTAVAGGAGGLNEMFKKAHKNKRVEIDEGPFADDRKVSFQMFELEVAQQTSYAASSAMDMYARNWANKKAEELKHIADIEFEMAMGGGNQSSKGKGKSLGRTGSLKRTGSLRKGGAWKSAVNKINKPTAREIVHVFGRSPSSKAREGMSPSPLGQGELNKDGGRARSYQRDESLRR